MRRRELGGYLYLFVSFSGRIRRLHWWLGSLGAAVVYFAFLFVAGIVMGAAGILRFNDAGELVGDGASVVGAISICGYIFLIWAQIALSVKRYHDRDKSGWWLLLSFVPIVS